MRAGPFKACALALGLCLTGMAAIAADDVEYKSGGIGLQESQAMKQESPHYSTSVTFSNSAGEYLASVKVTITAHDGSSVLDTVTDGPILLVNLPPGDYTLHAELEGRSAARRISVPAHGHRDIVVRL